MYGLNWTKDMNKYVFIIYNDIFEWRFFYFLKMKPVNHLLDRTPKLQKNKLSNF